MSEDAPPMLFYVEFQEDVDYNMFVRAHSRYECMQLYEQYRRESTHESLLDWERYYVWPVPPAAGKNGVLSFNSVKDAETLDVSITKISDELTATILARAVSEGRYTPAMYTYDE